MRAYSSLRQLEAKGICVDEYLTNERDGVFKARLDSSAGTRNEIFLRTSHLKTAVRLWPLLGRTPGISVSLRLKKEQG